MDGQAPHFQNDYDSAQEFMGQDGIPAWLVYDYRESYPIFRQVIHPSGHVTRPCYLDVHSEAVNLDEFETKDTRRIIPGVCFSVEPGIYLPEFGVRSEIDVFMSEDGPHPSSPVKREVVLMG